MYYECHITVLPNSYWSVALLEQRIPHDGWHFSKIDGDPNLGAGLKCYATKHFPAQTDFLSVLDQLDKTARALQAHDVHVIRTKIELILYDICSGVEQLVARQPHKL